MEYIKKEELKDGDVFVSQMSHHHFLNKYGTGYSLHLNLDNTIKNQVLYRSGGFAYNNMRLATSEEKHWLNTCIKLDKFITYDEAMKTFIPEYVECIRSSVNGFTENKIYKIEKNWNDSINFQLIDDNSSNRTVIMIGSLWQFKPSTKEAYDAQFVVKEPEFVLPEKWCILRTGNNYNIINKWFQDNNLGKPYMNYGYIWKSNNNYVTYLTKPEHRTEITFEQFKKYVLKEEIVEEKVIEPLPQFKIIETIETITKVENNEGNQFFIGDVVESEGGIIYTINGFKYNDDKTDILATTTINLEININKIEHYIEPKVEVEETLLEKAKRLYPIGTKFINPNGNKECVIKEKGNYFEGNNHNIYHSIANTVFKYEEGLSGCIYINNTWSKIIE